MKKTVILLLVAVLICFSLTSYAAAPTISSVSVEARDDGLNDVSVVVRSDALYSELTLLVMGSDSNGEAYPYMTIGDKSGYVYYVAQGNTGTSTSCTFNFAMDIPETMTNIEDYIYVLSGNTSAYSIASVDEFYYDVTFDVGEGGTVKIGEETATSGTVKTVSSGSHLNIEVTPDDGYIVKSVTFGNAEMIEYSDGDYSTGSIGSSGTITVEFSEDVSEPDVTTYTIPYLENGTTSIIFATLANTNEDYTLIKYGVVAGKTEDVKLGAEESYDLEGRIGLSSKNQYGIKIVDSEENEFLGRKYYVVPYAVYSEGTTEKTYYGTAAEIDFDKK